MSLALYTDIDDVKELSYVDFSNINCYSWANKQEFINSKHDSKVAVLEPDYYNAGNFRNLCSELDFCDLVVVKSMELNAHLYSVLQEFDRTNFVFVINGCLNIPLQQAKVVTDATWLHSTGYYYAFELKKLMDERLTPFTPKQYQFEVMYGNPREHRTFVKNFLSQYDSQPWFYQSRIYQTPGYVDPTNAVNSSYNLTDSDFWEDEIVPSETQNYRCSYFDIEMEFSQVMPFKVYNKTNYSLVCESRFSNEFSFFTEKIAKPMLAHRLFIVITGQHYLKNLKSLGFKTFDSIIDESYDDIEDSQERWTRALEQAVWLCKQDPDKIFKKIIPVLLHNADMITRLDSRQVQKEVAGFLLSNGYHK